MRNPLLRNEAEIEAAKTIVKTIGHLPQKERLQVLTQAQKNLDEQLIEKRLNELKLEALNQFIAWFEGDKVLEKNDCSRSHRLADAFRHNRIMVLTGDRKFVPIGNSIDFSSDDFNCFVVRNNWAAALSGPDIDEGDTISPYNLCLFEFRYSGKNVSVIYAPERESGGHCLVEIGDFWIVIEPIKAHHPFSKELRQQIRCICVALDAEVATHHVERAPLALNKKRLAAGKTLLRDYHVVDLAKRHRIDNPISSSESGRKVRLHFRRGHWRHFETHKTWIKWMLVGDPDLGFINKHYAL